MESTEHYKMEITDTGIRSLDAEWFPEEQIRALEKLEEQVFIHKWMIEEALAGISPSWRIKKDDKLFNRRLKDKIAHIHDLFHTQ